MYTLVPLKQVAVCGRGWGRVSGRRDERRRALRDALRVLQLPQREAYYYYCYHYYVYYHIMIMMIVCFW